MSNLSLQSLLELPLARLLSLANAVRKEHIGDKLELCSIINAKSGLCRQDCKFCAQSAKHSADISTYPLKSTEEIVNTAIKAREMGAAKFGIVTSGNSLKTEELDVIIQATCEIKNKI